MIHKFVYCKDEKHLRDFIEGLTLIYNTELVDESTSFNGGIHCAVELRFAEGLDVKKDPTYLVLHANGTGGATIMENEVPYCKHLGVYEFKSPKTTA